MGKWRCNDDDATYLKNIPYRDKCLKDACIQDDDKESIVLNDDRVDDEKPSADDGNIFRHDDDDDGGKFCSSDNKVWKKVHKKQNGVLVDACLVANNYEILQQRTQLVKMVQTMSH